MKISLPLAIQDWRAQLLAIVKGWRPSPSYSCRAQLPTFIDRMATLYRSIPTLSSTSHLPHSLSSNSTILIFGLVLPPLNLQRVKLHKFVKSQQRVTHHQLAEGELAIIPLSAFERMLPPPSPPRERLRRRVPRIVSSLRKESPLPSQSSYVNKQPTTLFASLHPNDIPTPTQAAGIEHFTHTDTEKQHRQIAFWNHQRTMGSGELYALHLDLEFH
jgi:hypothetical protein